MVQNNQKDRQSLSKKKQKAQKVKTYKEDLPNWGIPLTVIPKRKQFRQKKRKG